MAVVFLGLSVAVYRWGIPVRHEVGANAALGVPLAVAGAAIGSFLGRPCIHGERRAARIAVGALVVPLTVRRDAEFSFSSFPAAPAGPNGFRVDQLVPLTLPAGRYGVYAVGSARTDPDCRGPTQTAADRPRLPRTDPDCQVTSAGTPARTVELLPVKPGIPGFDATSAYRWVGEFDLPAPGDHSLTCRGSGAEAYYTVDQDPKIRGVVGALVHWPVAVLCLFGALPGLMMIANAALRRRPSDS